MTCSRTAARRAGRSTTTSPAAGSSCCARRPTTRASSSPRGSSAPASALELLDSLLERLPRAARPQRLPRRLPGRRGRRGGAATPVATCTSTPARRSRRWQALLARAADGPGRERRARRRARRDRDRLGRGRARHGPRPPRHRAARRRPPPTARAAARGAQRREPRMTRDRLAADRLHPLRVQLRDRGAARGPHARAHPRRQGAPRLAGLHLQQGDAPRPLPERSAPADVAAAPPRRRQLRGDRLGHRDLRDRRRLRADPRRARRRVDLLLRRRRAGQPPRRRLQRRVPEGARLAAYRSSALAQEKTGEAWVDAQLYGGHTRGEFEHAEVSVFVGKNPWMSQSFPRARVVLQRDRQGPGSASMIVIDPVRHRHGEAGRLPPARAARAATPGAWPRWPATLVQEDLIDDAFLDEHVTGAEPVLAALREVPIADYARRCGVDEDLIRAAARRIARRRERRGVRGPRHPAGAQQHAVLLPEQAALDPHRQLRQAGRAAPALVDGAARFEPGRSGARRSPGAR